METAADVHSDEPEYLQVAPEQSSLSELESFARMGGENGRATLTELGRRYEVGYQVEPDRQLNEVLTRSGSSGLSRRLPLSCYMNGIGVSRNVPVLVEKAIESGNA